jgi:hypothetical protein
VTLQPSLETALMHPICDIYAFFIKHFLLLGVVHVGWPEVFDELKPSATTIGKTDQPPKATLRG